MNLPLKGENILKDFIDELGRKVSIFLEESTMKRFNDDDICQTRLYVKNNCGTFIKSSTREAYMFRSRKEGGKFH